MKLFILILLFPLMIIKGQNTNTNHSFGFGLGNTASLTYNAVSKNTTSPILFIDYKNKEDSIKHYRFNLIFNLPNLSNRGSSNSVLRIDNFYFSIGLEKDLNFIKNENINIYYGSDLYYKTNIVKGKLDSWSLFSHGFGCIGLTGLEYNLNNDFVINTEFNIGLGYHQNEEGLADPSTGRILLERKISSTKNLSVGIRKYF